MVNSKPLIGTSEIKKLRYYIHSFWKVIIRYHETPFGVVAEVTGALPISNRSSLENRERAKKISFVIAQHEYNTLEEAVLHLMAKNYGMDVNEVWRFVKFTKAMLDTAKE